MAKNYGTGVSRVLDAAQAQITNVIFQQGKPPLDSEFTLLSDIAQEARQAIVSQGSPSGWLGSGIQDADAYATNPVWSNWFRFGQQRSGEQRAIQWAVVNGWMIPVTGTLTGTPPGAPNNADTWNRITLAPPPSNSGAGRIDFVFLEVWQARLPPNPSGLNKPSSAAVFRYGNVEGGYSFLPDDMVDPSLGFETTQRVQLQYRIRVVTGLVGLQSFPDGFDPANVKGRGAAAAESSFPFVNMRQALGDPGLWRAGDGTANVLGTVDGYTYAIPMCAVFRRNSVAWDGDPGQNLNGGFNRNPTAIDRSGWKTLSVVPTLVSDVAAAATSLTLSATANTALPTEYPGGAFIRVGDEVMLYTTVGGGGSVNVTRGVLGSKAELHKAGTPVTVLSGRPDGLSADQVAKTDIHDLRHTVNPGGFDYTSLLDQALDQALRGDLRANWKRSGGGPEGSFVLYQDKISASPAALGVTKLDGPDGYRQVWSDASYLQPFVLFAQPVTLENVSAPWGLKNIAANRPVGGVGAFAAGNQITIPIAQFKGAVGVDGDQVQFPAIDFTAQRIVTIRKAGDTADVPTSGYSVSMPTGPDSNLVITLGSAFSPSVNKALVITIHVQYGAGRGLSRRPDSVHSLAYLSATPNTLTRQQGVPANNIPLSAAWAPLWSKFRRGMFAGQLATTAESYVDPGSKTVVLNPFRSIALPAAVVFQSVQDGNLHAQGGLMPNYGQAGPSSGVKKWGERTDPLNLFNGSSDPEDLTKNTYVVLPRQLMPGWGAVHVPIRHTSDATFSQGINFGFLTREGPVGEALRSFVALPQTGSAFASFSTIVLESIEDGSRVAATYNGVFNDGPDFAGIRFFSDRRGLGRRGLEFPPFYGFARLFAVYEAKDYNDNRSAFDPSTRAPAVGGVKATNLLRQDIDGPTFWIEIDNDGDSTFILNADAIDLSKSPNPVTSFEAGHYVVEANIFGFDRGAFDLSNDCRIVLTQSRTVGSTNVATNDVSLVVPGPPQNSDSIAVTYSRTPYQGDAWGSQSNQQDTGYSRGPLTSGVASILGYTEIDEDDLSRPNQKVVQVLASKGFMTTLGTGRIAGDFNSTTGALDFRSTGYENAEEYPPDGPLVKRPTYSYGALGELDEFFSLGSTYHGCIERLPLGALFGSRDFRGEAIDAAAGAVGLLFRDPSLGQLVNVTRGTSLEQKGLPVFTATAGSGGPGQILVQVDGETGNLSSLSNYRTTRGGSAFVASGPFPGAELAGAFAKLDPSETYNSTLCGIAYLVRNTVTAIGSSEVSAGNELMLLIVTTAIRKDPAAAVPALVLCGTQGSGEGFSAADLYRISGHPLVRDGLRVGIDPSSIVLGHKISLKPRLGA